MSNRDACVPLADRLDAETRQSIEGLLSTGDLARILSPERARIAAKIIAAALRTPVWVKTRHSTALSWFIGAVNLDVEDAALLPDSAALSFWQVVLGQSRSDKCDKSPVGRLHAG